MAYGVASGGDEFDIKRSSSLRAASRASSSCRPRRQGRLHLARRSRACARRRPRRRARRATSWLNVSRSRAGAMAAVCALAPEPRTQHEARVARSPRAHRPRAHVESGDVIMGVSVPCRLERSAGHGRQDLSSSPWRTLIAGDVGVVVEDDLRSRDVPGRRCSDHVERRRRITRRRDDIEGREDIGDQLGSPL